MTKEGLVDAVLKVQEDLTKKAAGEIVDAIFDTITGQLKKGEEVAVSGFGVFRAVKRAARAGVNPKTGAKIQIPAKTAPKFRAAKALKEAVK